MARLSSFCSRTHARAASRFVDDVGLAAAVGEADLEQLLELEDRPVAGLLQPGGQRPSALGRDRVARAATPADRIVGRPGEPVGDELLRLLVQLALRPRPDPTQARSTCWTSSCVVHGLTASRPRMAYEVVVIAGRLDIVLPLGQSGYSQREIPGGRHGHDRRSSRRPDQRRTAPSLGRRRGRLLGRPRRVLRSVLSAYHQRLSPPPRSATRDHVLDIGCGTGQTTRDAARAASAGSALGVDLSSRMLDFARRRAATRASTNATSYRPTRRSTRSSPLVLRRRHQPDRHDVLRRPRRRVRQHRSALRPGGRLALLTWQPLPAERVDARVLARARRGRDLPGPPPARGPFALSDPDRVRAAPRGAGFADIELAGTSAACGSATTPTTPTASSSACWAGCSKASTTRPRPRRPMRSTHDGRPRHARRRAVRVGRMDHARLPAVTFPRP